MNLDKYVSENSEFLKLLFEQLPANFFYKNLECRYQFVSNICCQSLDFGNNGTIIGKTDLEVQRDKELGRFYYEDDLKIIRTGTGSSYVKEMEQDGVKSYFKIEKRPIKSRTGEVIGIVGIVNDITELTMLTKKLEQQAQTDGMTGLYNRVYLDKWIRDVRPGAAYPLAVISADCNRLKEVNDTYGHEHGDELICGAAMLFKSVLPKQSLAFRLGGDEFLLICEAMGQEQAKLLVARLQEMAKERVIEGQVLSISYGIGIMEHAKDDFAQVCRVADTRMYENKKEWKATIV